jgi:hypothetical protein
MAPFPASVIRSNGDAAPAVLLDAATDASARTIGGLEARMTRRTIEERFWSKVEKRSPDECWEWQAGTDRAGYGLFRVGPLMRLAHRVAWELTNGPIPEGLCVLHRCDHPPCCNPNCLFLGTNADNSKDMVAKGRHQPFPVGDRNPSRLYPERLACGERHGSRTHRERVPRGERQGSAKLTELEVREIRRRFAAGGVTKERLARQFGVSGATVGQIVRRKKWAYLPDLDITGSQFTLPFSS